jgi:DNA-binding PadR family transcriptional regulator
MTIEKDILRLLSKNESSYHEIISQLKDRYEGSDIGLLVTKLNKEMKIRMSNEDLFIYEITDLGKFELKNVATKFYLSHWKWLIPTIITVAFGLLNYLK